MPIVVTKAPYRDVAIDPPHKRWTRIECDALERSGLLNDQKLELIDGELISKIGNKRPHVNALMSVHE